MARARRGWPVTEAVFLAVLWMMLENSVNLPTLILGLVAATIVMSVLPPPTVRFEHIRLRNVPAVLYMTVYFLKEVVVSNLVVARLVLQRQPDIHPGIVAMPLRVTSNIQLTALANMITLTPGTLSVEVSPDRKVLYVHCIEARDVQAALASAYRFEDLILEVTQ